MEWMNSSQGRNREHDQLMVRRTDKASERMDRFEQNIIDRIGDDFRGMAVDHAGDVGVLIVERGVNQSFEEPFGRVLVYRRGVDHVIFDNIAVGGNKGRRQIARHEELGGILWVAHRDVPIGVQDAIVIQDMRGCDEDGEGIEDVGDVDHFDGWMPHFDAHALLSCVDGSKIWGGGMGITRVENGEWIWAEFTLYDGTMGLWSMLAHRNLASSERPNSQSSPPSVA